MQYAPGWFWLQQSHDSKHNSKHHAVNYQFTKSDCKSTNQTQTPECSSCGYYCCITNPPNYHIFPQFQSNLRQELENDLEEGNGCCWYFFLMSIPEEKKKKTISITTESKHKEQCMVTQEFDTTNALKLQLKLSNNDALMQRILLVICFFLLSFIWTPYTAALLKTSKQHTNYSCTGHQTVAIVLIVIVLKILYNYDLKCFGAITVLISLYEIL